MNRRTWLLLSTAFLAALAIAGLLGMVNAANAALPTVSNAALPAAAGSSGSSGQNVAAPSKDDPFGIASFNCADISRYGVDRQMNLRAAAILQKCGYAPKSSDTGSSSGNSGNSGVPPVVKQLTSPLLGGTDIDLISGTETPPNIVQSETFSWSQGSTVVVAYNDSRGRNASPINISGASVSTDSGATFTRLTGANGQSPFGGTEGDPVVLYDPVRLMWLTVWLDTACGAQGLGGYKSATPSVPASWTHFCVYSESSADRESGWVDSNPASSHYGRVYISWNDFAIGGGAGRTTHSDDAGVTWSAPVNLNNGTPFIRNIQFTGDQQGSGKVYVAGMDEGGGGLTNRINHMYRSTDGGGTWADSVMGAAFQGPGRSTSGYFALAFSTIWRHMGWGQPAANGNNVFYDWAQCGTPVVCSGSPDHGDIYFQRSTDSGATWSSPAKLNTDSGTAMQWQPSLAATTAGAVYAGWYDERDASGGGDLNCTVGSPTQGCYKRYGRVSLDGGATWQADSAVSDVISPLPAQSDPGIQPTYEGDYGYISAEGDTVYDHWTDGRVLINNASQQDVFFDKINVPVGTPTPTVTGTPPTNTPTSTHTNTPTVTPTVCGVGVWSAGPPLDPGRYAIQGAVGTDGKFYTATGLDASSTPLPSELARYDPTTNTWSDVAPPPVAVGEYSLAADGGKIFIAGGFVGGTAITSTLQIYNIASNSWTFGASMPASVEAAAGIALNGKFYVVGGDDFASTSLRSTYIYDIASNSWTTGPLIPDTDGRTNTYGTAAGGLVYVWGGMTYPGAVILDNLLAYDPGTNSWTSLSSANTGGFSNYGAVSPFGAGKLFITDGGDSGFNPSNTTHIYDIATDTYTSGSPMLGARLAHAQATLPDGRVFVYSGLDSPSTTTDTSELLSATPCFTPTPVPTDTPTELPTHTPTPVASSPTSTTAAPSATSTTAVGPTQTATTVVEPTNTSTPVAPTPTACTLQFRDVRPGSTFYQFIHCLVCLGIVSGYPDGTFRPNANLTRGQLSKIVSNSAGFSDTPTGQQFQDVAPGSTFYDYIYRLSTRGYISGYPCGGALEPCVPPDNLPYFRPNQPASRGQIAKIVSNAAGFSDTPSGQQFQDVPPTGPGSTFYAFIYRLVHRGLINGYACGSVPQEPCVPPANLPYFRPNNNTTRGQMSKIDDLGFFPNCNIPARPAQLNQ